MADMTRKKSRPRQQGPVSLEAERRRIMITIHAVEKELFKFWEAWLKSVRLGPTSVLLDCAYRIHQKLGYKIPVKDAIEFDRLLSKCDNDPEFADRLDVPMLQLMCDRHKAFQDVTHRSVTRIQSSVDDHLGKYCLSFIAEIDDLQLFSVQEYETNICEWREQIYQGFKDVKTVLEELSKYTDNFNTYIEKYPKVLTLMQRTYEAFQPMFEPVKNWVMADENYPRKLQDEIGRLNKEKQEFQEANRRLTRDVGVSKSKMNRRQYQTKQIQHNLDGLLEERRTIRRREMAARKNLEKTEFAYEKKKRELKDISAKYNHYQHTVSPDTLQLWSRQAEQDHREALSLEHKLDTLESQIRNLKADRYDIQKEIHAIQKELDGSVKSGHSVSESVSAQESGVKITTDTLKTITAKIETLRRIREIKLHSDTVKKIHLNGYSPGGKLVTTDPLDEAFKLTAAEIGKEWSLLYQRLPFKPDRDIISRVQDLESIDITSRRLDADFSTLSLKSLDKWRRLSDYASVNALLGTLRRIKKHSVAQKIERTLVNQV